MVIILCITIYHIDLMAHIGKKIEDVLREKRISVVEFAKLINTNRNNVYSIFKRESVDTELLRKIGEVLEYNFFEFLSYCDINNEKIFSNTLRDSSPTYTQVEKLTQLEEKIKQLETENSLLKQRLEDKEEIIMLLKK